MVHLDNVSTRGSPIMDATNKAGLCNTKHQALTHLAHSSPIASHHHHHYSVHQTRGVSWVVSVAFFFCCCCCCLAAVSSASLTWHRLACGNYAVCIPSLGRALSRLLLHQALRPGLVHSVSEEEVSCLSCQATPLHQIQSAAPVRSQPKPHPLADRERHTHMYNVVQRDNHAQPPPQQARRKSGEATHKTLQDDKRREPPPPPPHKTPQ
ncbi:uncharacterized protein B0I36DRAFT_142794 [Microdochium trichocladiopsis]|uniref:Uncharacterized protein n=1 Tax=Microdochium trichocladiopsis TaxID=1682393 RepID=A0A9P9BNH3_9PEZI|nr:uncharacterized protein B0I36DRAFT_142794 [Microdochium trichocladiopsis]KAH7027743.1 hypothetical protein B0I36DRAFT_142794 [Microdochium trichocladiopsis]